MKNAIKLFRLIVLTATISFSITACSSTEDDSSIPTKWQGLYEYVFEDNGQAATVNIKSDAADFADFRNNGSLTDLTSGKVSDLSVSDGGKIKSANLDIGNWVYVYQGDKKVGIIVSSDNVNEIALAASGSSEYVSTMTSTGITFSPSTPSGFTNPTSLNSNFTITWFIGKKR
jgi:hypothetical protein